MAGRSRSRLPRRDIIGLAIAFHLPDELILDTDKGVVLRKFALLTSACAVLLFAGFASAQRGDIMVSGSTLMSFATTTDIASFQPPVEKGGTYVGVSADVFHITRLFGLNVESSWRHRQTSYYGYENYRPIFTDANLLYQYKLAKKTGLDLMGGIGVASDEFNLLTSCSSPGCVNYTTGNHFMEDLGAGIRYRVWRHIVVRPEAHYYHIQNNLGFNSSNVFRLGASIGYTIGSK